MNEMASTPLAKRIRKARLDAELTLADVAAQLGITPAAVSHWESGRTEPTDKNLKRLREILDAPETELAPPTRRAPSRAESKMNDQIDAILEDAEARIAELLGCRPGQVKVAYTFARRS